MTTAVLIGLIGYVCGACVRPSEKSDQVVTVADQSREVQTTMTPEYTNNVELILHLDQDTYLIGEAIRPQLQIKNLNEVPVTIDGFVFSWDALGFTDPNFVHLLDPMGKEQLLPYRQADLPEAYNFPVEIKAHGEQWLYLPISAHQRLRQVGPYEFWLELKDSLGEMHVSNKIQFELVEQSPDISAAQIDLEIEPHRALFKQGPWPELEVTFTNHADEPLTFLKPQGVASYYSGVNPIYQFTVHDETGRALPLARTEGDLDPPTYGADTQFRLQPGESYSQRLPLLAMPALKQSGEYQVRLTYIVRENELDIGGVILDAPINWADDVFIGRIESNTTTVKVK